MLKKFERAMSRIWNQVAEFVSYVEESYFCSEFNFYDILPTFADLIKLITFPKCQIFKKI